MTKALTTVPVATPELEVRHHNAITSARYEYSEMQLDLFFYLLSQLKREDTTGVYHLSIKDLAEVTGKKQNHVQLKKATEDMGSRVFEVLTKKSYKQIWMFQSVEYLDGDGTVAVKLSEDIRPYLFELRENFTSFQLRAALRLSSKYAKRIYQLCSQWKDRGETPKLELEEFKRMLALNAKGKDDQDKFKGLSELKRYVLDVAKDQINKHTDLEVEYVLSKTGRSFTHVKFRIRRDQAPQLSLDFKLDPEDNKAASCKRHLETLRIQRPDLVQQILSSPELITQVHQFVYDLNTNKVQATKNAGGLLLKKLGLV